MDNEKTKKTKSKARKILNFVTSVILGVILGFIIVCFISVAVTKASGQEPNLFGYRFLYILTDSMEPELPVGTSIIVKNCKAEDINVGDYVCYEADKTLYNKTGVKFITHECIEAVHTDQKSGKQVITTQGVKDGAPVDAPVEIERVQAKFVSKVPNWMSKVFTFLVTPFGFTLLIGIPLAVLVIMVLFGYIRKILKKEKERLKEEIYTQEVSNASELIIEKDKEYFLREQEKIKQFLAMQNSEQKGSANVENLQDKNNTVDNEDSQKDNNCNTDNEN